MAFLAPIALAVGVLGTAVSAYGTVQAGRQANQAAKYQARVEENNAVRAGYSAVQAGEEAQREVEALRADRRRVLSQNVAAASKSGLQIGGSVTDVMQDSALQSERDIQMAVHRGQMSAYNLATEADSLRANAAMTRLSGRNAQRGSYLGAGGSLLSSGSSLGLSYASYRK